MRSRWLHPLLLLFACTAALGLSACASTKSGSDAKKKRTVLLTEHDDARVGREASVDIAAQMGVLDDPELTAYVSQIGKRLLRGVPRRSFHYEFHIVDQTVPNAFALPGGYIFISRGLLALTNNEDELACVIGHEITHAARRHAAAQQALSKAGNPLAMPWARAARQAAYGRDMERDADKGGQILCAAAGYDPIGMSTFLRNLGQTERLRLGYERVPSFFDTHPGSQERAAVNAVRASEMRWKRNPALGDPRKSLLDHIDGLAVGQRPEGGVFEGTRFIHPDLDFQMRFPAGWQTANTNMAVGATSPRGDAVVFLSADMPEGEPQQVAEDWVMKTAEEQKIKIKESKPVKVGELDAWRMKAEARSGGVSLTSYVTFIPYRGATWRITGMARSSAADRYLGRTLSAARSFRPLTEEERNSVQASLLRVATARRGETLAALSERTDNAWDHSDLAIFNGVFNDHRFEGGELVKIVHVEPYVPKQLDPPAPPSETETESPEP